MSTDQKTESSAGAAALDVDLSESANPTERVIDLALASDPSADLTSSVEPEIDEATFSGSEGVYDSPSGWLDEYRGFEQKRSLDRAKGGASGRVAPQSLEAEQSVIGAILIDNESLHPVLEVIVADDFYHAAHRAVFSAMVALSEGRHPIDLVTLTAQLRATNELELSGGAEYLSQILDIVPTAAHAQYYARLIKESSLRRMLIHEASEIVTDAYEYSGDVDVLLDTVEQRIFKVSESKIHKSFYPVSEIVRESIKHVERLYVNKEPITGVATGFVDLDSLTSGLQKSDLVIIAGRPSMGKTSLALSIAGHVGVHTNLGVAVFSLEMSKEQIVMRMLCSEARVSNSRVRSGKLMESDLPRLVDAASKIAQAPIYVDDTPAITALEMRAKVRRLHREHPLGLVVVDYLQLMRSANRRTERRDQEISEISGGLKALAKELNIPIVALSQLNRAVETRQDKRPIMADLRESGAIEQDADIIGFVYRDEVYNPDTQDKGIAELIIAKHRNGAVGTVQMAFQAEYTLFENLAKGDQYDYLGADLATSSTIPDIDDDML